MNEKTALALATSAVLILVLGGCGGDRITPAELAQWPGVQDVIGTIDADRISTHVEVLASDAFEGRRPGTLGEERTLQYLVGALSEYGLEAPFQDGYLQPFDIDAFDVTFQGSIGSTPLVQGSNIVAAPWVEPDVVFADVPVVFGGYGLVSEAHGRDDYAEIDLNGAAVVVLGGSPPGQDSLASTAGYGAKQAAIAERGGVAMIVVWPADEYTWADTRLYYVSPFFNRPPATSLPVLEAGEPLLLQMLLALGADVDQIRQTAASQNFRARPLPGRLSGRLQTQPRSIVSHNVVAQISGTDPALANEWIVFTAHWDHLGRDPALTEDQIYNGAMDNATGTAALLELARGTPSAQRATSSSSGRGTRLSRTCWPKWRCGRAASSVMTPGRSRASIGARTISILPKQASQHCFPRVVSIS